MVRGERERHFNRRLTRLYNVFTSHTGRSDFAPLTSFLTLKRAGASYAPYLVLSVRLRTERLGWRRKSKIEDIRIEYRGSRLRALRDLRSSILDSRLLWDSRIPTCKRW